MMARAMKSTADQISNSVLLCYPCQVNAVMECYGMNSYVWGGIKIMTMLDEKDQKRITGGVQSPASHSRDYTELKETKYSKTKIDLYQDKQNQRGKKMSRCQISFSPSHHLFFNFQ